jgi:hypothetical protein
MYRTLGQYIYGEEEHSSSFFEMQRQKNSGIPKFQISSLFRRGIQSTLYQVRMYICAMYRREGLVDQTPRTSVCTCPLCQTRCVTMYYYPTSAPWWWLLVPLELESYEHQPKCLTAVLEIPMDFYKHYM